MKRFPVVEDLITVVDDVEKHAEQPRSKQEQECNSGTDSPMPLEFGLGSAAPNSSYNKR